MSASLMSAAAKRLMPLGVALQALSAVLPSEALAQSPAPFVMSQRSPAERPMSGNFVVTLDDVAAAAAFARSQEQGIHTFAAEPWLVRVPRPSDVVLPVASHFVVTDVDVAEVAAFVSKTTALASADRPVDPRRFASIVLPKTGRPKANASGEFAELQISRPARGSRVVRF